MPLIFNYGGVVCCGRWWYVMHKQRVSRKRKGSNNWLKALRKVAKLHEYVANCRKDWHRKLSHQLCDGVGMIFAEDLQHIAGK